MAETRQKSLIFMVAVLLIAFLGWARTTTLDLVTHGQGRVVPRGQNSPVQIPHSGTITMFRLVEGDAVVRGQVLAEINPTDAVGALAEAQKRIRSLGLRLARLDAESNGTAFDLEALGAEDAMEQALLEAEAASMMARKADLQAREATLLQTRSQRERDLQALQAELAGIQAQSGLITTEIETVLPLVADGVLGFGEEFRLQREAASNATRASVLAEQIAATQFAIAEAEAQMAAARATTRNAILEERVATLAQLSELTERLPSLQLRVSQTEVRAPITGVVNQVFFNQVGAVVKPGDIIAEIVPETSDLRVEALIAPQDIANIEPGQKVRISLTAYNPVKYGTLDGEVLRVSADASMREEVQQRMYVIETSIEGVLTDADGFPVRVLPGMIAQVDVVRGERTILDYFWNPVIKVKDRAFRE